MFSVLPWILEDALLNSFSCSPVGAAKGTWNLGFFKCMVTKDRRNPEECPKDWHNQNPEGRDRVGHRDMKIQDECHIHKRSNRKKERGVQKSHQNVVEEPKNLLEPKDKRRQIGIGGFVVL